MKHVNPVILAGAAILSGLATAIASATGMFKTYSWLVPWLYGGSILLLLLAGVIALVNSIREQREQRNTPPPPNPSVQVNQENRQEFNPQFNPQIIIGGSPPAPAELDETATSIRAFWKSAHPPSAYTADEVAKQFNLTKSRAWSELKKQQDEGWARPVELDQGTLWMFYDVEL